MIKKKVTLCIIIVAIMIVIGMPVSACSFVEPLHFISNCGDYEAVVIVPTAGASGDAGVAFYNNGERVEFHSTYSLVRRHSRIRYYMCVTVWLRSDSGHQPNRIEQDGDRLSITTIDNIRYTFDITTGEIVSSTNYILIWYIAGLSILALSGISILILSGIIIIELKRKRGIKS